MKKFYTIAAALTMLVLAAGCSKDETPEQSVPEFPAVQEIPADLESPKTLTFSANMDWKLSVTASWVRFVDGDVRTQQLTGKAGSNIAVEIECSDEGQDFDEASADIDMTMGGTTQTIFRIVRDGKERWIKLYHRVGSDEWEQIESLSLHYNSGQQTVEMQSIRIVANYAWKGTVSDYVTISSGNEFGAEANEYADFWLTVSDEKLPFAFETAFKTTDMDGGNAADFAITYDGMGDEDIFYRGVLQRRASFSKAGKKMTDSEPAVETDATSIEISVYAKDMKYSAAILYSEYNPMIGDTTPKKADETFWLKLKDDGKGKLTLTADENTSAARKASLVIIPGEGEINLVDDYTEYTITISQESGESENPAEFYGYWGLSLSPITFTAATDEQIAATAQNNLPAGNTYYFSFKDEDVNGGLIFTPLGFLSDYNPFKSYKQINIEGEWPTKNSDNSGPAVTDATISSGNGSNPYEGKLAISYGNLDAADFASGITVFLFYSGADTDKSGAPVAALILEKEGEIQEGPGTGGDSGDNGFLIYKPTDWGMGAALITNIHEITFAEKEDFTTTGGYMMWSMWSKDIPANNTYVWEVKGTDIDAMMAAYILPYCLPDGFIYDSADIRNWTFADNDPRQGMVDTSMYFMGCPDEVKAWDTKPVVTVYSTQSTPVNSVMMLAFYAPTDSGRSTPLAVLFIKKIE